MFVKNWLLTTSNSAHAYWASLGNVGQTTEGQHRGMNNYHDNRFKQKTNS